MKIYTKTGDDGSTGLFSGRRVSKDSSYIDSYGTVDEVNSLIGWCLVEAAHLDSPLREQLVQIQHDLHAVCADLATPLDASVSMKRVTEDRILRLEKWMDAAELDLKPLKNFILAGGDELAARLHIARTVARRAERITVTHAKAEEVNPLTIRYLNRLSDYLFMAARWANHHQGISDVEWNKNL
jgi:cob(I)alamin adenosyltransferase